MAICKNCGMEIIDDAKFCTNCGAPNHPASQPDFSVQGGSYNAGNAGSYNTANTGSYSSGSYSAGNEGGYSSNSYSAGNEGGYSSNSYSAGNEGGYSPNSYSAGNSGAGVSSPYGRGPVPGPGFVEAVKTCFSKYADFSGRARRSEYWYFVLFSMIGNSAMSLIGNMIFGAPSPGKQNILVSIFTLAITIPSLAVSWRRMHDIGKKGTWNLIALIPVIGWILVIMWECRDSYPGTNEYGESPKYPYGA